MKITFKTTYDAGKLARALPRILERYGQLSAESLAKDARARIKKGLRPALKKSTIDISKRGISGKRRGQKFWTSKKPLLHTGSLLASIKANTGDNEGEVEANAYIAPHLTGYKIVSNSWIKKHIPGAVGADVPARNPFFTPKGHLRKSVGMDKHLKELHKFIHKSFKK